MNMKHSVITILVFFLAGSTCVFADITYTTYLSGVDASIASQIEVSIAEAVGLYNKRGSFNKHLYVYYEPTVPTADGNYNGTIRFGGQRTTRVALHEISHTLGVGTHGAWSGLISGGIFTGSYTTAQVEAFDGLGSRIYADGIHFWNYGLNYETEDSFINRFRHVRIVANILCDMGLVSFSREPEDQVVPLGGSATFNVVVASAAGYAWYKQGSASALTDGGGISGATTDTLQISNINGNDEGHYYCVVSGSLSSRPARLTVGHAELYDRKDFAVESVRTPSSYEVGNKFLTGSWVTLWRDSDGSMVTEVLVPGGTAGYLIDGFRYAEIPEGSLTLAPNTAYVVSADITGIQDAWLEEEDLIPNADFINENVDDSTTWQGRWGTPGQRPASQWHTGTFYGLVNITSKMILRADYDSSGIVDLYDLEILSQNWLQDVPVYDIAPQGGDGMIDLLEFQILAEEWLR
jgi:hypothetical protein